MPKRFAKDREQNIISGFNTCLALVTSGGQELDCMKVTGPKGTVQQVLPPHVAEQSEPFPNVCLGVEELPAPLLMSTWFMLVEGAGAKAPV